MQAASANGLQGHVLFDAAGGEAQRIALEPARYVTMRFALAATLRVRPGVGLLALALLLAAEFLLAVMLQERPLAQYIASRDPVSGAVYVAVLVLYAAMPLIVARERRPIPFESR